MPKKKKADLDKLIVNESLKFSDDDNFFLNHFTNKNFSKEKTGKVIENQKQEEQGWFDEETEGQLSLDVYQDDKNIYVKSTIAGAKPEDIEISVVNDMLTIRGKREKEEKIEGKDYLYQECYWGRFSRSIILPTDVNVEKIKAELKDGILTVILPKIKTKPVSIKVKQ